MIKLENSYIFGKERMWNNTWFNFLFKIEKELKETYKISRIVLKDSENVKKNQICSGYIFKDIISKSNVEKILKNSETTFGTVLENNKTSKRKIDIFGKIISYSESRKLF